MKPPIIQNSNRFEIHKINKPVAFYGPRGEIIVVKKNPMGFKPKENK